MIFIKNAQGWKGWGLIQEKAEQSITIARGINDALMLAHQHCVRIYKDFIGIS